MKIEKGEIILPNDPELVAQLTSRRGWPDSKGRLQLESKADMRSRGLASPDRADAVLGAMLPAYQGPIATVVSRGYSRREIEFASFGGGGGRGFTGQRPPIPTTRKLSLVALTSLLRRHLNTL